MYVLESSKRERCTVFIFIEKLEVFRNNVDNISCTSTLGREVQQSRYSRVDTLHTLVTSFSLNTNTLVNHIATISGWFSASSDIQKVAGTSQDNKRPLVITYIWFNNSSLSCKIYTVKAKELARRWNPPWITCLERISLGRNSSLSHQLVKFWNGYTSFYKHCKMIEKVNALAVY